MWDTYAWMETAAKNGLTAVAAVADPITVTAGDDIEMRFKGAVRHFEAIQAAGNGVELRFHRKQDPNWVRAHDFFKVQTDPGYYSKVAFLNYLVNGGDLLTAEIDNANNNQYDALIISVDYSGNANLRLDPVTLPPNARWVSADLGTAAVAATWTETAATYDFDFDRNTVYGIYGLTGHSATMYAIRVRHKVGQWVGYRPGCTGGDTALATRPLYGNFGTFIGASPPDFEVLCSGADAAQYVAVLVAEVGSGRGGLL
jgi:hypothetical protein